MGLETLTAVTAGASIIEGIYGMNAADAQADSLRYQLTLMRAESEADIARYAEQTAGLKAKQKLAYLKSGVTLEGSPLEILDETVRVSAENISAMRAKTTADILSTKSKISALRGQGRAALVGGFTKAASVYASQARKTAGATAKELRAQLGSEVKAGPESGFNSGSNRLNLGWGN